MPLFVSNTNFHSRIETVVPLMSPYTEVVISSFFSTYFSPDISASLAINTLSIKYNPFISETKVKEPNFTLKRTFRVENTGLLPITIKSAEINGQACEGYGFKVLNCQEFALKPNTSKDLIIL